MRNYHSYIASLLSSQRQSRNLTQRQIADKLAPRMDLRCSTVQGLISEFENGLFYGRGSEGIGLHDEVYLSRLALYVKELNFLPDTEQKLVDTFRNIDRRFVYPSDGKNLIKLRPLKRKKPDKIPYES